MKPFRKLTAQCKWGSMLILIGGVTIAAGVLLLAGVTEAKPYVIGGVLFAMLIALIGP